MKAKEMFEELGFKKYEDIEKIVYSKPYTGSRIIFNKKEKYYSCDFLGFKFDVKMRTHIAINKQLKELGWLDE